MWCNIGCNIIDVANQLSFVYRGLAPELRVFISPLTESTRVADLICILEKKQEVWHEIMTTPIRPQRYYSLVQKPSFYRLPLPSQSEAFSCYQSQHRISQLQQSWQLSK